MSDDRAQRIARITRDVRRRAYPPPADPREPLIIGNPHPPSPVIVMRADFVALAEELADSAALRTERDAFRENLAWIQKRETELVDERDALKEQVAHANSLVCLTQIGCGECDLCRTTLERDTLKVMRAEQDFRLAEACEQRDALKARVAELEVQRAQQDRRADKNFDALVIAESALKAEQAKMVDLKARVREHMERGEPVDDMMRLFP